MFCQSVCWIVVYHSGLFNVFLAVFSGGVLIGLKFVILSLILAAVRSFSICFYVDFLRRTDDMFHTKLVFLTQKIAIDSWVHCFDLTIIAQM